MSMAVWLWLKRLMKRYCLYKSSDAIDNQSPRLVSSLSIGSSNPVPYNRYRCFKKNLRLGMALITTGKGFIRDLEQSGALGVYVPLEGGFEGRYQRRLRASGYVSLSLTARGLGDVSAYLTGVHGVRPPHLGKKTIGQEGAVGLIYYVPPIASYRLQSLPPKSKGLVLWIIEGNILSPTEVEYLANLPKQEPRLKVVVEMGGDRAFSWKPLLKTMAAA
jgi:NAD(P)H-quinone oxidoreductase subunit N